MVLAVPHSLLRVLFCALVACCVTCGNAKAYWEDFSGPTLDTTRWLIQQSSGAYPYQNDGLYMQGGYNRITTYRTFSSGTFTAAFQDFTSTNLEGVGQGRGAIAGIILSSVDQWVRIERDQNGENGQKLGFFEVNQWQPGWTQPKVWYIPTEAVSGKLRIDYVGGTITFTACDEAHPELGWQQVHQMASPFGPDSVKLSVFDHDAYGTTSLKVNYVDYQPVPEPAALLLLVSGLAGVAVLGRRFKK